MIHGSLSSIFLVFRRLRLVGARELHFRLPIAEKQMDNLQPLNFVCNTEKKRNMGRCKFISLEMYFLFHLLVDRERAKVHSAPDVPRYFLSRPEIPVS